MEKEKICVGIDKRIFYKNGVKYTIEMIQLDPEMTPLVTIWTESNFNPGGDAELLSVGTWNGLRYVCDNDDDPNLYDDNYEKVNSLCQEMVV